MTIDPTPTFREAIADGATRWELRKSAYARPYRGVIRPPTSAEDDPDLRIADARAILSPGDVITGWAAARLQGAQWFDGRNRSFRPIPITIISAGQHRPREGIRPTRRSIHPHEVLDIEGIRVATLPRAAYDMALDAPNLSDAVVAYDMCLSRVTTGARTTPAELSHLIDHHVKTRGIQRAREAMSWCSDRSASPWETQSRLIAVRHIGLTGLLENVPVFNPSGELLGIVDLLEAKRSLVVETDGDSHRSIQRHPNDNAREEALENHGLTVCRLTPSDIRTTANAAARITAARQTAGNNRAPRWTLETPPWWGNHPLSRRWAWPPR